MTSKVWIQLPVFGNPELTRFPNAPNSHKTNKIIMIVQSISDLLNLLLYPSLAYQHEHAHDRLMTAFIVNFTECR